MTPRYHYRSYTESDKRNAIIPILSPLCAGPQACAAQELEARTIVPGTIPIHADVVLAATILPPNKIRRYLVGGLDFGKIIVTRTENRRVYIHLIMTSAKPKSNSNCEAKILVNESKELREGDGVYVECLQIGDRLQIDSVGSQDAEFVVIDSN